MKYATKFFFLILFSVFSIQGFAQTSQAVKFDSYSEKDGENLKLLDKKINRFLKKLKKDSSVKGYVFIYDKVPRLRDIKGCKISEITAPSVKQKELVKKLNLPKEQIKNSCFRFNFEVEFWIVKEGEKLPDNNTNCADFDPPCCCPTLNIISDETVYSLKNPLIFKADITLIEEYDTATFEWFVSNGKIISGQGTNEIKVDISDVNFGETITATVEASGSAFCNGNCPRTANFTVTIKNK
jgi:hypothetical protein